jgi:hypothetical protein
MTAEQIANPMIMNAGGILTPKMMGWFAQIVSFDEVPRQILKCSPPLITALFEWRRSSETPFQIDLVENDLQITTPFGVWMTQVEKFAEPDVKEHMRTSALSVTPDGIVTGKLINMQDYQCLFPVTALCPACTKLWGAGLLNHT